MTNVQEEVNIEHQEMLKYCQNIMQFAPQNSVEYKIANLALIQLNKEHIEIIELCSEIKENSQPETIQNKIAQLVLSQYKNSPNNNIDIPNGWKLVPIIPVQEMFMFVPAMVKMKIKHDEYDVSRLNERNAKWIYDQMLKRVPVFK